MELHIQMDPTDRRPDAPIAIVIIGKYQDPTVKRVTPAEARQHAAKLIELADQAEGR